MPAMWKRIEARRVATVSVFRHWAQACVMATVALTVLIGAVLIPDSRTIPQPMPATSKPDVGAFLRLHSDAGGWRSVKLSRLTIALYVGLIFASGVVLGVFGTSLYAVTVVPAIHRPQAESEEVRKKTIADMQARMKLTDEQVSKINVDLRRNPRSRK